MEKGLKNDFEFFLPATQPYLDKNKHGVFTFTALHLNCAQCQGHIRFQGNNL